MKTEFAILYWFQGLHNPVLDKIAIAITSLGNAGLFWILLTLLMLILSKKSKKTAWTSATALILSAIIVNLILKNLVMRDRPCWIDTDVKMLVKIPRDYSFPSGHSSASFASAVAIFLRNKKLGTPLVILALLIALSRLYLFVHWPTDVLAGTAIGIIQAIVAYFIVDYIYKRYVDKSSKTA
jgi:undecaprenyl-diphosphatase